MAISVLQRTSATDTSGANNTLGVALASVTAGSNLIVIYYQSQTNNSKMYEPTDTLGNKYKKFFDHNINGSSFCGMQLYIAHNSPAGANTVTIAPDGNNPSLFAVYEVAGLDPISCFDVYGFQDQGSTANLDSLVTQNPTRFANELLIGSFMVNSVAANTFTIGAGYVNLQSYTISDLTAATEEKIVAATGAYNATVSQTVINTSTLAVIFAFSDTFVPRAYKTSLSSNIRPHPFSPGLAR